MATGFMSGFGPAFAGAFQNSRARIEQREDDLFKIKYSDFLRTREERTKTAAEEQKALSQAQQMAKDINDPNAAAFIYKQILDFGVDDVQKKLEDGRLTFDEGYKPQDIVKSKTVSEETDRMLQTAPGVSKVGVKRIDSRLEDATNGQYAQVMAPAAGPYNGVDSGAYGWDMTSKKEYEVGEMKQAVYDRDRYLREGDIAKAQESQNKINAIIEADALAASAKAKAEQNAIRGVMSNTWRTADGTRVFTGVLANDGQTLLSGPKQMPTDTSNLVRMSVAELEGRSKVREAGGKVVGDYQKTMSASMSVLDLSGRLMTIVNMDENVLADTAGTIAETVSTGIREVDAFTNLVQKANDSVKAAGGNTEEADKLMDEAEKEFNNIIQSPLLLDVQNFAARKKVFDNLRVLLAYRQAEAVEPGGRFSDKDIDNQLSVITAATTKQSFIDGLRGVIQETVGRTKGLKLSIESNGDLGVARQNFAEEWGYDMYQNDIKGIEYFVANTSGPNKQYVDLAWQEYNNPTLFTQTQQTPTPTGAPTDMQAQPQPQPQSSGSRFTPEEIEAAKQELLRRQQEGNN